MVKELFFEAIVCLLILFLLAVVHGCSKSGIDQKEAQEILNKFYADNVPESIIDRHLIRAGKPIVPFLLAEIQKKDMPKRRYAIGALGKIGDKRAVPVLVKILEDRSELIYFRADSLESIWHIDEQLGEEYAKKYQGESEEINRTIDLLRERKK